MTMNTCAPPAAALAEMFKKYEKEWSFNIAYALAYRGEADRAFEQLQKPGNSGIPI